MPFTALAQSRCVLHDMTIDSVPPDVVDPAPFGLLNLPRVHILGWRYARMRSRVNTHILKHIAITSASIWRMAKPNRMR